MSLAWKFFHLLIALNLFYLPSAWGSDQADPNVNATTRLSRPSEPLRFNTDVMGISERFLRNLRSPTVCRMLLCNGRCASIVGSTFCSGGESSCHQSEEAGGDRTPCGLPTLKDELSATLAPCCSVAKTLPPSEQSP